MSSIKENLERIQKELASIVLKNGPVQIEGVAKFQPLEKLTEAVRSGVSIIGVNYVQEGEEFRKNLAEKVRWHFIGHIQSRKAKNLVDYDCVESLDRLEVAEDLNKRVQNKRLDVLIEVNIGNEAQKSGIAASELESFLKGVAALSNLNVRGLMGMPPPLDLEERRPFFRELFRLWSKYQAAYGLDTLSM